MKLARESIQGRREEVQARRWNRLDDVGDSRPHLQGRDPSATCRILLLQHSTEGS